MKKRDTETEGTIEEERHMKKNRLGNTDIYVTPVAFGVLTIGNTQLDLSVSKGAELILSLIHI